MSHSGYSATTQTESRQTLNSQNWRLRACCRFLGFETFYPPDRETVGEKSRRERAARNICAVCPVLEPCRDHALRNKEEHGIWGGLTASERRGRRDVRSAHSSSLDCLDQGGSSSLACTASDSAYA
ncbi:MAG: WhiB family transcriptional regulator [Hyphomicrobiales bacterium]|nr:MAG: WhiB family transcriptional regulator [Hyphomicrobiales bacterium]